MTNTLNLATPRGAARLGLRPLALSLAVAAALALAAVAPAAAQANLGFAPGSPTVTTTTNLAGGYPDVTTSVAFQTDSSGAPGGNLRDLTVDLPVGFSGNVPAVPACPTSDVESGTAGTGVGSCAATTQVGTATIDFENLGTDTVPVWAVQASAPYTAEFAFSLVSTLIEIGVSLQPGDHHLQTKVLNASTALGPIVSAAVTIWGVPADPSHDPQRENLCIGSFCFTQGASSGAPPVPFLRNPTSCSGQPMVATISASSWQQPADVISQTSQLPAIAGCEQTSFAPSISITPTVTQADSPTGLTVDLQLPQSSDPNVVATSDLKAATVVLPAGFSLSPSAATGLQACTDAQLNVSSNDPPACPLQSKIGDVTVTTPSLPDQLTGGIYIGQPLPADRYRIFLTFAGDNVMVKLTGSVHADLSTGQLTTTFDDNPQLPFSDLKLEFFGGPQAVLATPESCGTFTASSDLTPWSGIADALSTSPLTIDSGCVSGFSPSFTAGTENAQAGAYSPFVLSFSRSDTDQEVSGLTVKLPPGMGAKLAGVQECSDAQLAAAAANTGTAEQANPSCPAGSQVGTVETGAGPGSEPLFVPGKAYLTGSYKGAPYGLAVIVPALAGPYDLGTVVVRQALYVDPTTAQVTAVSDPFPTILQGIPLRLRRIDVDLNRPDFTINPTNCNPMSVTETLSSTGGPTDTSSSPFQVGGCQELGFSPRLGVSLTGEGKTRSGDHPTLTTTLTQPFGGQANIASAKVALPVSLALDPVNSEHVCNYDVAQAAHGGAVGCPANTIVGQASAVTPLLSQPLTGPVYLVQGIRFGAGGQRIHTLPSLLMPLRGQIALDLRAQSSVNGAEQLVTTFSMIPDAAVSKFTLQINGGPNGILVITGRGRTICGAPQVANAQFGAQSGKTNAQHPKLATPACRAVKHTEKHGRRRHKQ